MSISGPFHIPIGQHKTITNSTMYNRKSSNIVVKNKIYLQFRTTISVKFQSNLFVRLISSHCAKIGQPKPFFVLPFIRGINFYTGNFEKEFVRFLFPRFHIHLSETLLFFIFSLDLLTLLSFQSLNQLEFPFHG